MQKDLIRYDLLVQDALKGVVRKVLGDALKDGLPGDHHFYISFRTDFSGVRVSQRLREKYPEEMTIVLQHQYWDLAITEHSFEVGLSFSGIPEKLLISFDALTGFFDPSVQFGLKFEIQYQDKEASQQPEPQGEGASVSALPLPDKKKPGLPALARKNAKPSKGNDDDAETVKVKPEKKAKPKLEAAGDGAEVVSLDSFRKKT